MMPCSLIRVVQRFSSLSKNALNSAGVLLRISTPCALKRSPAFPDIPTVAESAGLPDFEAVFWQGMVVPAGTPKPIIDKLQKAIVKIAADPEMIERFKQQGVDIRSSTPEEFKAFYAKEEKRWVTLIKEQGIKPE